MAEKAELVFIIKISSTETKGLLKVLQVF